MINDMIKTSIPLLLAVVVIYMVSYGLSVLNVKSEMIFTIAVISGAASAFFGILLANMLARKLKNFRDRKFHSRNRGKLSLYLALFVVSSMFVSCEPKSSLSKAEMDYNDTLGLYMVTIDLVNGNAVYYINAQSEYHADEILHNKCFVNDNFDESIILSYSIKEKKVWK